MTNNLKAPKNDIFSLCKLGSFIITNLGMSHMRWQCWECIDLRGLIGLLMDKRKMI